YFTKNNSLYHIDQDIKRMVTFKKHDLLRDAYPMNIDLLVCRNVLIYFTDEAKHMIYQKISNALSHQGILFVGSTEQIFNPMQYNLSVVDTFFYEKYVNHPRSEEHTSELQSRFDLVCRLLLEKQND